MLVYGQTDYVNKYKVSFKIENAYLRGHNIHMMWFESPDPNLKRW